MKAFFSWFTSPLSVSEPELHFAEWEKKHQELMTKWVLGSLAALALTIWIAMAEVDRLIADAATGIGRSASASSIQSVDSSLGQENWAIWQTLYQTDHDIGQQVAVLLRCYFSLDLFFTVVYTVLLLLIFWRWPWAGSLVLVVFASEVAENVLQFITLHRINLPGAEAPVPSHGILLVAQNVTTVKWASLAILVVGVCAYPTLRRLLFHSLGRTWQALFIHRITVAAVLLLVYLALLPVEGVADQLPDTQRAWIEANPMPFYLTCLIVLTVVFGLFFVGRMRSKLIWDIYHPHRRVTKRVPGSLPRDDPKYLLWFLPPALLLLGFLIVGNSPARDYWTWGWPLACLLVVPAGVAGASWIMDKCGRKVQKPKIKKADRLRSWDAWRGGDVLAMVFLAVSGMALVRSFTAPLALMLAQGQPVDFDNRAALTYWIFGMLVSALAFPVGAVFVRLTWRGCMDPREPDTTRTRTVKHTLLISFVVSLAFFAVFPAQTSGIAGVPGTAVLLVGGWAFLIGVLVISLQDQMPLRLFDSMRLEANPVLSLIAVIFLVGTALGGTPSLHNVRPAPQIATGTKTSAVNVDGRNTVRTALNEWLAKGGPCVRGLDGSATHAASGSGESSTRVRPMILVAAEGGGIRAASWTVRAFEKLADADDCAKESVLLSSGISGGSLGLSLASLYGDDAVETMKKLAKPGPLAAAVTGAMAGDMVGAVTGLKIPTRFRDPTTGKYLLAWNDRAGLVESLWEQSADKLAAPFSATVAGPAGALLLNSTDTGTGCRVVVSQLNLPETAVTTLPRPQGIDCTDDTGFPLSVDLLDRDTKCPINLRWSTATMLSGRFPIITPGGRIPAPVANGSGGVECSTDRGFQLIDGGYSEASALGTITDIWPVLQKEVLAHNTCVVALASPSSNPAAGEEDPCAKMAAADQIVVPVFLFLQNSPGSDIVPRAPKATAEFLVPIVGYGATHLQSASAAWIQRLEESSNVCPDSSGSSVCNAAAKSVAAALGNRSVVVVAPNSVPALAAPLGWSLSGMSQNQLEQAMDAEALIPPKGPIKQDFAKLLRYLGPTATG
ncbi:hypothetical protein [Arthrobacter sp. HY1533]|uniref:hypothetical protein n=1 Tax=Arthrobacter sp. HY1533 TaxID=2970919 RepID=UPI0022BA0FB6|nr:hypothetical protein [Arthrobacter sp. HY1533]